jgi:hypothetical protein
MTIHEMIYQFKLRAQRIDTKSAPGLKLPQIIIYLNMGMLNLLKSRYNPNNKYNATLESIQKRIDEWQMLVVPHETIKTAEFTTNVHSIDILKLKQKYLFLLRITPYGSKGSCNDQKFFSHYSSSDDLNIDLDNPNSSPNFDWRETLHRFASDKILVYTDGTFKIQRAELDYLRYPKPLDIKGYTHFNGSPSADVNCELPEFLHDEIVNESVIAFELGQKYPGVEASMALKNNEE